MAFLEVPFTYARTGHFPRCRNPDTRVMYGMALAEVPEVAASDAPVVARCRYASFRPVVCQGGDRLAMTPVVAEVDYRLLGGTLMRRAVMDDAFFAFGGRDGAITDRDAARLREFPATEAALAADGVASVTRSLAQPAMRLLEMAAPRTGMTRIVLRKPGERAPAGLGYLEADSPFARSTGDDRRIRAAEASAWMARGSAFVGDILYLPSFGPAWVGSGWHRDAAQVHAAPEAGWLSGGDALASFGADARALVAEIARRRCKEAAFLGRIEVQDPSALPLWPEEFALREAANQMEDRVLEPFGQARSVEGIRACADMVEALADLSGGAEGLMPALSDLAAAWRRGPGADGSRGWVLELIDDVLTTHDIRQEMGPECNGLPAPAPRPGI